MKKVFIVLSLLATTCFTFAQQKPVKFNLNQNRLEKISDFTPKSNSINDIIIVGDTIWLGTSRGVSRSTDNGNTWTNYFETEAFGTEGIFSMGYAEGIIWVATGHVEDVNGSDIQTGSGLRYSTDGGDSWTVVPQSVDDHGDSLITYGINTIRALPITVPQQNVTFDLTLTTNTIWTTSWAGGLRKSTDRGATWERIVLPPDFLDEIKPTDSLNFALQVQAGNFGPEQYLNHVAFSVLAVDDSTLYVGTANGLNKSTDGGLSWRKFNHQNQTNAISGNWVVGLAENKVDNTVWAVTWKAEESDEFQGVSATWDGGNSWNTFLAGEKAYSFGFRNYFENSNLTRADIMVASDNGVYRSSNDGASWILPPPIKDDITNVPIATTVFFSANAKKNDDNSADIWLGSANGLAKLVETTGFWTGTWKVFLASPDLTSKTETYAYPNPFSPDDEQIKIKYNTNNKNANVTIRILDFGMNLVRTLIQNAPRTTDFDQIEFWDGRDEAGIIVPNGVYFYRIDVGSDDSVFNKIIVLK